MPSDGEEVILLAGPYSLTGTNLTEGANNMNVHGDFSQPAPVITADNTSRISVGSGTISYMDLEGGTGSGLFSLFGSTSLAERLFIRGPSSGMNPVCQCYFGVLRDSVVVGTGTAPALGVNSNGASNNVTYRNVTAYTSDVAAPAIELQQLAASGTLNVSAHNVIALNGAGGPDALVDGNGTAGSSTLTFDHSNYRTVNTTQGGTLVDTGGHQTELPLFANATGGDFSELAGSPTIDAGATDPLNGDLDFAGNPRTLNGATDIGALEFVPPVPVPAPGPSPGGGSKSPPTFTIDARKVKINAKGNGLLPFTCKSPSPDSCTAAGTLTAGGVARSAAVGRVGGTVQGGKSGTLAVKLTKRGRRRLAAKRKLRVGLSGSVSGASGLSSPLSAALILKAKR